MDELVETFDSKLVSEEQSKDCKDSNFKDRYKKTGILANQEQRRKELLEEQKHGRQRQLDSLRGIKDLVDHDDNDVFQSSNNSNKYNKRAHYTPTRYVAGFNKKSFRDVLMMSEWMIEKPGDFSENWYITPCPKGLRVLAIACQGFTKFFTKYGRFKFQATTMLPGGSDFVRKPGCTILDGFYYEANNTFYILDVLAWNSQTVTDCETEFRVFWLNNKMKEMPELTVLDETNEVIFSLLPKVPCTPEDLNSALMTYPPFPAGIPEIDGFLFYHKRAHYVSGDTPLVGWLFPYMINEVLGSDVTVNPEYENGKPSNYVNQAAFIEKFTEEERQRKKRDINRARRYRQRKCICRCRCKCNKVYNYYHYYLNPYGDPYYIEYGEDSEYGNYEEQETTQEYSEFESQTEADENVSGYEMEAEDTSKVEAGDSQTTEAEVPHSMDGQTNNKVNDEVTQETREAMPPKNDAELPQKMEADVPQKTKAPRKRKPKKMRPGEQTKEGETSQKMEAEDSQIQDMESEQVSEEITKTDS